MNMFYFLFDFQFNITNPTAYTQDIKVTSSIPDKSVHLVVHTKNIHISARGGSASSKHDLVLLRV